MSGLLRLTWTAQAAYYLVTGIWPLLSIDAFQAVTGPKVDLWLVRMVGLLAAAIGAAIGVAVTARRASPEILVLSLASAASFAAIDVVYALGGRISPIYLADAAVEAVLIAATLVGWARSREGG